MSDQVTVSIPPPEINGGTYRLKLVLNWLMNLALAAGALYAWRVDAVPIAFSFMTAIGLVRIPTKTP